MGKNTNKKIGLLLALAIGIGGIVGNDILVNN